MDPLSPVPDSPDAVAKPRGIWATVLTTLPVVLTVLATAFAGMSSSEMTQAMYHRSLASQRQSKAGDQWAYFQAKRVRGTTLESTAELLESLGTPEPFLARNLASAIGAARRRLDAAKDADRATQLTEIGKALAAVIDDPANAEALEALEKGRMPRFERVVIIPPREVRRVQSILSAIHRDPEARQMAKNVSDASIDQLKDKEEENLARFEEATANVSRVIGGLRDAIKPLPGVIRPMLAAERQAVNDQVSGFRVAVNRFDAKRYREEAEFNRQIAELWEFHVWRSGQESDRHRERSKMFFYSMLVAQAGVTIASLALARQQRKSLWLMAALAGVIALGLSTYVYLSL
jgi:hypothetical protein